MRWRLAVPLVVLLAGCSGFSAPGGVAGTQTTTLTPVDVPQRGTPVGATPSSPTPTSGDRLVAGLTERGVTDPFALAGAHRSELANVSYTKTTRTRLSGPNGTLRAVDRSIVVAPGTDRYHLVETSESTPSYPVDSITPRLEIWYADAPALFRVGEGENASYRVGMSGSFDGPVGDVPDHDRLVGLYGTVDGWSVQLVEGETGTLFVLESRAVPDDVLRLPVLVTEPTDARLRVVLTDVGRVVSYRLRYEARFDGRPVRVVRRIAFSAVGNTTVTEPTWYDEALAETADDRRGDG